MTAEAPTLTSYLVFNTVAKRGNLSVAAKDLMISQPAVSRSLSKLEDGLNVRLFVRSSRGVKLTPEGELLYEHTKSAFESLEMAEQSIRRVNSLGLGKLRVGVSPSLCKLLLTPKLRDFGKKQPNLKPDITLGFSASIIDAVENDLLDVGIICKPVSLHRLEYIELMKITDTFVASPDYVEKLLSTGCVNSSKNMLECGSLLLPEEGSGTRQFIDSVLDFNEVLPNSVTEVKSPELLLELAKSGAGIAALPKEYVLTELLSGNLTELPISLGGTQRSVGLVFKKTSLQFNTLNLFLDTYDLPRRA